MSLELRPTSLLSDILIHPAIWPQHMGRNLRAVPLWGGDLWDPSSTMWPGPRATSMPSGIYPAVEATIDMGRKLGALPPFGGGGAGSPSNTMWSGPRPTCVPSFILFHPTLWPHFYKRSPQNGIDRLQKSTRKRDFSRVRDVKTVTQILRILMGGRIWNDVETG